MYQNTFETLAVEINLIARKPIENEKWLEIGCFIIKTYVEQLSKVEKSVIGHIKALFELEEENFIKLSSIGRHGSINCEIFKTEGSSLEGHLTLNGIIAEISKEKNINSFHTALERTCCVYELLTDYKESVCAEDTKKTETCPECHGHHHHNGTCGHKH